MRSEEMDKVAQRIAAFLDGPLGLLVLAVILITQPTSGHPASAFQPEGSIQDTAGNLFYRAALSLQHVSTAPKPTQPHSLDHCCSNGFVRAVVRAKSRGICLGTRQSFRSVELLHRFLGV